MQPDTLEVLSAPEETTDVSLEDEEQEKATPCTYDELSANLVDDFMKSEVGEKALEKIGHKVVEDFDAGFEATSGYRDRIGKNWKLFTGELKPKTPAFKDAANVHVPIALENISRIYFRAVDELFGDWQTVFGVVPLGAHDDDAKLLSTHGNWQIRTQISDFTRQMHAAILGYFFIGDVTIHSYYSEVKKMNRHEVITPDEFVIPYRYTSRMNDYSDVPWMVKVITMYRHELQQMKASWRNIDKVLEEDADWDAEPEAPIHDKEMQKQRIEKPDTKGTAPYKLLWYEGWLCLPAQGATADDQEADKDRWCQAIVDKKTEKVLSLIIFERPNWQDKLRFETQQNELTQYRMQMQAHDQAVQAQQMQLQTHMGVAQSVSGSVGPMQEQAIGQGLQHEAAMPPPPPPVPPKWMKNPVDPSEQPEPARMEPVHLFTHAVCIEPLVGNLGLGFGMIQADYNLAANTAFSQFTDAATLANIKSYIVRENIEFNVDGKGGGQIAIGPGTMNKVSGATSDDLHKDIIPLEFSPANPQLLDVVKTVYGYGQSSAQSPEALSGEPGKSGETARGLGMRIEQATKQLSVPTRKFANTSLCQVLRNNAYLNSIYLPDEEIFAVQDDFGAWQQLKIGRELYDRNYHVEIRGDLRFVSQTQRIQEADEMVQFVFGNQVMAQNLALAWMVVKKSFEARGRQDMIPFLGPQPPPPQTPLGVPPPPQPGTPPQGQPPQGGPGGPPPPHPPGPPGPPQGPPR